LVSIPRVGVTIASALIAAIGKADSPRDAISQRGLVWFRSNDNRWEAEAFRDQQARQQIPPKVAHPRR
jgi:hypothetical protein